MAQLFPWIKQNIKDISPEYFSFLDERGFCLGMVAGWVRSNEVDREKKFMERLILLGQNLKNNPLQFNNKKYCRLSELLEDFYELEDVKKLSVEKQNLLKKSVDLLAFIETLIIYQSPEKLNFLTIDKNQSIANLFPFASSVRFDKLAKMNKLSSLATETVYNSPLILSTTASLDNVVALLDEIKKTVAPVKVNFTARSKNHIIGIKEVEGKWKIFNQTFLSDKELYRDLSIDTLLESFKLGHKNDAPIVCNLEAYLSPLEINLKDLPPLRQKLENSAPHAAIVSELKNNWNVKDMFGDTPILSALREKMHSLCEEVLPEEFELAEIASALPFAACNGDIETVNFLLAQGVDIEQTADDISGTALYWAVFNNQQEMVKLLLDKGAIVDSTDENGNTPLHTAVEHSSEEMIEAPTDNTTQVKMPPILKVNNKEIIKLLLAKGASLNVKNNAGITPLMQAVINGTLDVIAYLIKKGAKLQTTDNLGNNLLHAAAQYGHFSVVKFLVNKGFTLADKNNNNETPLLLAAKYGHPEIVTYLLRQGASLHTADIENNGPLHWAAFNGHHDVVKQLIKHKADVNQKNNSGETPLHWGARNGKRKVIHLLLADHANINEKNDYGMTPLHLAASEGRTGTVKILLDHGADIHASSKYGTPIYRAVNNGYMDTIEFLANHGANINDAFASTGNTLVHEAIMQEHAEVVQFLISKGADLNRPNLQNETPLQLAAYQGKGALAKLLVANGSLIDFSSPKNKQDLLNAVMHKDAHPEMINILLHVNVTAPKPVLPADVILKIFSIVLHKTSWKAPNSLFFDEPTTVREIKKMISLLEKAAVNSPRTADALWQKGLLDITAKLEAALKRPDTNYLGLYHRDATTREKYQNLLNILQGAGAVKQAPKPH